MTEKEMNKILSVVAAFNSSIECAGPHAVSLSVRVFDKNKGKDHTKVFAVQLDHKPADVTINGVTYEDTSYKNYLLESLTWVNMGIEGDDLQELVSSVVDEKVTDYKETTDRIYNDLLEVADPAILTENLATFALLNNKRLTEQQQFQINSLIVEAKKKLEVEQEEQSFRN